MRCVKAGPPTNSSFDPVDSERIIIHIDMDAFFASVEHLGNPSLVNLPVVVCGDPETRTVVAAANYVAREYGIRSGMPASTARKACPQAIFIEGNPQKYVYFSLKLKAICEEFTPLVEAFSIDESFLDVTATCQRYGGPMEMAKLIKKTMQERLGLTASAGLGPNKLMAKMASGFAKPDGLSTLWEHEYGEKFYPLPIDKMFGIGEKTAEKLKQMRIKTIDDLRTFPLPILERLFGVPGSWMHQAANGIDKSPVIPEEENPPPKSVGNGYTLDTDTVDQNLILKVIYALCCKVGRRLRKDKYAGRTLTLLTRFSDYRTISRGLTTEQFLCLDKDLYNSAKFLYFNAVKPKVGMIGNPGRPRHRISNAGPLPVRYFCVSVSNLSSLNSQRQLFLFDLFNRQKYEDATKSMDFLRDRWGERVITWGSLM